MRSFRKGIITYVRDPRKKNSEYNLCICIDSTETHNVFFDAKEKKVLKVHKRYEWIYHRVSFDRYVLEKLGFERSNEKWEVLKGIKQTFPIIDEDPKYLASATYTYGNIVINYTYSPNFLFGDFSDFCSETDDGIHSYDDFSSIQMIYGIESVFPFMPEEIEKAYKKYC